MANLGTIKLDAATGRKIAKYLGGPLKIGRQFFDLLGVRMDQLAMTTFRLEGARAGRARWRKYSRSTTKTDAGTWKIRYGTDLSGRPKGSYIPGRLRKGIRRYSNSSKLLQASGMFRNSFGTIASTNKYLIYGTKHRLAKYIMRLGRNVLFLTIGDRIAFSRLFRDWYARTLRAGGIH